MSDRDIVHFLHREGFITQELHDEILNPRSMWTDHQKVGELVTGVRNKVKLSAQDYHTLLDHLRPSGKHYRGIVDILDAEYSRQEQTGKYNCGKLCNYTMEKMTCLIVVCILSCL